MKPGWYQHKVTGQFHRCVSSKEELVGDFFEPHAMMEIDGRRMLKPTADYIPRSKKEYVEWVEAGIREADAIRYAQELTEKGEWK